MKRFLLVLAKRTGGFLISVAWKLAGLALAFAMISQVQTAVLHPESPQGKWLWSMVSSATKNPAVLKTLNEFQTAGKNLLTDLVESKGAALPQLGLSERNKPSGSVKRSSAATSSSSKQVRSITGSKAVTPVKVTSGKQADVEYMAQEMLKLINEARANAKVSPLKWDPFLARVAEARARDMIRRNYCGHYGRAEDKFARMVDVEVYKLNPNFNKSLAENIFAGAKSVSEAHTGFMNSPGHRANILDPRNKSVGIAFVRGVPKTPLIQIPEGTVAYTCVQVFSN